MKYKKILIVDDEPGIRETLSSFLRPRHFKIYEAGNGDEALKVVKKIKPDLIILDIMMPVMDGFELLAMVRRNPVYSKIPVIVLTVKNQGPYIDKGIALNANFYLPKPVKLQNLLMFINLIFAR
jgi:CheY-like chemotaxis protein